MKPAGIVLAGGLSRRMQGPEKSLLILNGATLISRVAERLREQVADIAINANGDAERFQEAECPVISDTVPGHVGPLAGVLTGMRWAAERRLTHIATVAADTPFFPYDLVPRLRSKAATETSIVMASSGGRVHPVCALWPVSLADALEDFLVVEDKRKILEFAERYDLHEEQFLNDNLDPFFNINTPDDLAEAKRHLEAETVG
ncbi:MAG: molybdenum cofactor guanylyltransferase MobA [Ahrensia sp.]|nr:molybdenum cofactor guanylyltransferase MobA [Ahrensia sp.]